MAVSVKVRVPGTTANCGPGFDSVGIACTIYNEMQLTLHDRPGLEIKITGQGAGIIPAEEKNIGYRAVREVLRLTGQEYPGIYIEMNNDIPLARGLGSSAAAIVAGLVAANAATGNQLSSEHLLDLATSMEGHPDNVAPAIFGGVTVSMMHGEKPFSIKFLPPDSLKLVVIVPDFGLSTRTARQVLPQMVEFKDAVFNVSRTATLIAALCQGRLEMLRYALEDKLHQPYRAQLIPGMDDVLTAAAENGALGAVLSGAGPCLMAYTTLDNETAIGEAMRQAFAHHGVKSTYKPLKIDSEGARIITTP